MKKLLRVSLFISVAAFSPIVQAHSGGPTGGSSSTGSVAQVEAKKEAPLRFYGLGMDYSLWDGTNLNAENYSNEITQLFIPSWKFGKIFFKGTRFERASLSGRFTLGRELVGYDEANFSKYSDNGFAVRCSKITPSGSGGVIDPGQVDRCQYDHAYRWHQSDLWLSLGVPKIVTIPVINVSVSPGLRFVLPTSAESQFSTLRIAVTPSVGLRRSFLSEKLGLGYSLLFTKNFHEYTTPGVRSDGEGLRNTLISNGYQYADIAESTTNFLNDPSRVGTIGGFNPSYSFMQIFGVDYSPTEKWSFSMMYILSTAFAYDAPCTTTVNGQMHDLCAAGDRVADNSGSNILRTGRRDGQIIWITAGYQFNEWLNLNAAWITSSPQRKADGSIRQPFISTNYDAFTSLSFGATVSIEKAAAKFF